MAKKFPKVATDIRLKIQEAYRTPNSIKTNETKHTSPYPDLILNWQKPKIIFKEAKEKNNTMSKITKKYGELLVRKDTKRHWYGYQMLNINMNLHPVKPSFKTKESFRQNNCETGSYLLTDTLQQHPENSSGRRNMT